ncbi:MAG: hypothetical protein D6707_11720 [Bacteroidetes bacterium]|nr:MAG: hypothetical protein D6707_11720 [Bacteroidota bacterium]
MKAKIVLLTIIAFGINIFGANAQQKEPDIRINVNKKYDENGNLIEYDSTYTYFYSNANVSETEIDSIMQQFMNYFNFTYPSIIQNHFNTLFFNDSLMNDFFYDDFFEQRFLLNDQYFRQMMQEMDSIKNAFFYHPKQTKTF